MRKSTRMYLDMKSLVPETGPFASNAPVAVRLFGKAVLVLLGTVFLALCSWIEVPMYPVPMTMQTFGVVLIGFLFGWRLGGVTVVAWLLESAMGLPVLAGGAGGSIHFVGPTAGYLFAFPLAAVLAGLLRNVRPIWLLALVAAAGHLVVIAVGVSWLAQSIGWSDAWLHGASPFLIGMVLKSALAAAAFVAIRRKWRRV